MKNRRVRSPFAVGAVVLAVIAVLLFFGFTKSVPFLHHYEINAVFTSSNELKPGSPVRIAGVEVGEVTKIQPTHPGAREAKVTMRIKDAGRPVHADATAKIRPRIFLEGNFFVDLTSGSPSAPELGDGGTIPIRHTAIPVQLDQVLDVLTSDTRGDLRTALAELYYNYLAGGPKAFDRSLPFQAPAFKYTAIVADALLGKGPHDLSTAVYDLGRVSQALDRDPRALKGLVTDFDTTAAALARRASDLQDAVAELPRTLRTGLPALAALNRSFPPTQRLARAALPGVRSSGPTIDALMPLVTQLRGLVRPAELKGLSADLRAAVPDLARLTRASVPLLGQVRLASSCQNEVILPWTKDRIQDPDFPASGPVYEEAVKYLPGLGGESRSFDANGQFFKVLGTGGVDTFDLGDGRFGTGPSFAGVNPPKPQSRPPLDRETPCETQQPPDLRSNPGAPPPKAPVPSTSPAIAARAARARTRALDALRGDLARAGLGKVFHVAGRDATRADVESLARSAGNLPQLRAFRSKAGSR